MSSVSEKLSDFVLSTGYRDIPAEVVAMAKKCILDFVGVSLAGSAHQIAEIVREYLICFSGKSEATVIGSGAKTSSLNAAFLNGIIGHSLDYDDVLVPAPGGGGPHVTAAVFPASLAVCEAEGLSGKDLIAAYILGCEVTYRVGRGVDPTHYLAGWHTTSTEGVFGATVAAGKLLDLNYNEMVHALGISGSLASGLRENFGTMTKFIHPGQAAENGIKSAFLAKLGFTSSRTIFEGVAGFCNVLSTNSRPDQIATKLGDPYGLLKTRLKLYPACGAAHSAIDAAINIRRRHELADENIETISITANPYVSKVLTYDKPTTGNQGKFSLPFCLAVAMKKGAVTLHDFTDETVKDPSLTGLMRKITVRYKHEISHPKVILRVRTRNGREYEERVNTPKGGSEYPLSFEERRRKYTECSKYMLSSERIKKSMDIISNIEKVSNVRELIETLVV